MRPARKKRRDPRSEITQIALIEAAEQMFAEDGIEAVSIRQIGAAIGSSNNGVVAYHFGSKEALIEAIFRHRLPDIQAQQRRRLAEADAAGKGDDLHTLLLSLWMPLFEQVNDAGLHSYGRFLAAMIRKGIGRPRSVLQHDFPTAYDAVERISRKLAFPPGELWELRWRLATMMVLDALSHIDLKALDNPDQAKRFFDDAVKIAEAALAVPCRGD